MPGQNREMRYKKNVTTVIWKDSVNRAFGYLGGYQKHGRHCGKACVCVKIMLYQMFPAVESSFLTQTHKHAPPDTVVRTGRLHRSMGNTVKPEEPRRGDQELLYGNSNDRCWKKWQAKVYSTAGINHWHRSPKESGESGLNAFRLTSDLFAFLMLGSAEAQPGNGVMDCPQVIMGK